MKLLPLDAGLFPQTWQVVEAGLRDGVAPGFAVGVWRKSRPEEAYVGAWGVRRLETQDRIIPDTPFDLASVSKVFATAALAAVLVERGWLEWDTSVAAILPGYRFPEVQIRHLLSHTAGYKAWQPYWERLLEKAAPVTIEKVSVEVRQNWMRQLLLAEAPEAAPGEKTLYSDLSFMLLGFALEEVAQMPLDQAVKKWVWNPMGISGAYFQRVTSSVRVGTDPRVAATENCPWRKAVLQGQVHDDNCWAMGGYAGHAGAFGTAMDLLQFSRSLLEGYFSPRVIQALWTRASEPPDCSRTLGWDTPTGENPSAGRYFSPASVGHLGFTGTSLWIDPFAGLAVTLLSNRVHPSRENNQMKVFRPQFHEAIWQDLAD